MISVCVCVCVCVCVYIYVCGVCDQCVCMCGVCQPGAISLLGPVHYQALPYHPS